MISKSTVLGVGAAAVLAAALIVPFAAKSAGSPEDPKLAYRPPPDLGAGASVTSDPVWNLGRKLFFDTRLSASSTMSCASCHKPDQAWSDHLSKARGDAHLPLAFRVPTLLDAGQIERYGWIGRFPDIESVAFFAMGSPKNMNLPAAQLLARLTADAAYEAEFHAAFTDGAISKHNVGAALARFVRSISSGVAPFDRWVAGDTTAISPSAERGFALFSGKGRCAECHSGWAFTDGSFHDIGIATGNNVGRGALFKTSAKLQYAFKTPTLRDVALRGPYMHDGSLASLADVVDHYDKGGIDRPSRAEAVRPLQLSREEKDELIAFLGTLTGGTAFAAPRDN